MRVYELAKEYEVVSTGFLDEIQGYGIKVKSHLASLTDDQIATIRQRRADTEKPEVKEFLPPPDVVEPVVLKDLEDIHKSAKEHIAETAEKTKKLAEEAKETSDRIREERAERILEQDERADEVAQKLDEIKKKQWAEVDKPKGFFGWLASLFS